jgi:hypothetical protein
VAKRRTAEIQQVVNALRAAILRGVSTSPPETALLEAQAKPLTNYRRLFSQPDPFNQGRYFSNLARSSHQATRAATERSASAIVSTRG